VSAQGRAGIRLAISRRRSREHVHDAIKSADPFPSSLACVSAAPTASDGAQTTRRHLHYGLSERRVGRGSIACARARSSRYCLSREAGSCGPSRCDRTAATARCQDPSIDGADARIPGAE
jgi:hypothetical protein